MLDTANVWRVASRTEGGYTLKEIADEMGLTPRQISNYRKAGNVAQKPNHRSNRRTSLYLLQEARDLLDDGASYAEVSRTFGVSTKTLAHWLPGRGWSASESASFGNAVAKSGVRL